MDKSNLSLLFLLFMPVLFALTEIIIGFDSVDVAYLFLVVIIFTRHYLTVKKDK